MSFYDDADADPDVGEAFDCELQEELQVSEVAKKFLTIDGSRNLKLSISQSYFVLVPLILDADSVMLEPPQDLSPECQDIDNFGNLEFIINPQNVRVEEIFSHFSKYKFALQRLPTLL